MMSHEVTAEIHGFSQPDATPTPWAAGLELLRTADTFWLSTVRPDGRPHVTPLIAVWHADALWFATGPDERKATNLARNPSCVLTTGASDLVAGGFDVVIEGRAEQVTEHTELEHVADAIRTKYPTGPWDFVVRGGAFSDRALWWSSPRVPDTRPRIPQGRPLQPDDLAGLPMSAPDAHGGHQSQ